MPLLTIEQIQVANDAKIVKVDLPEWGEDGFLFVRNMTGKARDDYERKMIDIDKGTRRDESIRKYLLLNTVCDEQGELILDEQKASILMQKSGVIVDRLFAKSIEVNAIGANDIEELKKT